ncbi:MAG: pilin [Patescibacteria group bacterium]
MPADFSDLENIFKNGLNALVGLCVLAALIMALTSGLKIIMAGGDQKKLEQARGTLTWSLFGLFGLVLAWLGFKFLNDLLFPAGSSSILEFKVKP